MKKIVWIFSLSWAVFCLITTGAIALQPGVFNSGATNPNVAQDEAASIYNQGARAAYHQNQVTSPEAVFIDAYSRLENLSVRYWLYPANLATSRYGNDLTLALQHPEQPTIVYVGPHTDYKRALPHLRPGFQATIVKTLGDDVFVIIKEQ
jgi:hypothetical protein